jgi:Tol biopolymer transport system component
VEESTEVFELLDRPAAVATPWMKRIAIYAVCLIAAAVVVYLVTRPPPPPSAFGNTFKITRQPGLEDGPVWSPDGRSIAYAGYAGGNSDIFVQRISDGRNPEGRRSNLTKTHLGPDQNPAWSPDGTHIAYSSFSDSTWNIFAMSSLGGNPSLISNTGPVGLLSAPAWSPDGIQIVFAKGDGSHSRLFTVGTDGLGERQITPEDGPSFQTHPAWSPDGKWIAYNGSLGRQSSNVDVWVVATDGENPAPVRLTEAASRNLKPTWSVDGRHIWFISDRGGSDDLWYLPFSENSEGTPQQVTVGLTIQDFHLTAGDSRIVYSRGEQSTHIWRAPGRGGSEAGPTRLTSQNDDINYLHVRTFDGRIAFDPKRGERRAIFLWDQATDEPIPVTDGEADYWGPTWSPDGRQVAFYSNRNGNRDVGVISEHGGTPIYLTESSNDEFSPEWSPDGRQIIYSANINGNIDLYTIPADGGDSIRVTEHESLDAFAKWSPDGRRIAFTSNRTGQSQIWVIDVGTGKFRQVTENGGNYCAWSMDSGTLYYTNRTAANQNIFAISPEGGVPRQLTHFDSPTRHVGTVALAADADYVYFTVSETIGDIWTMEAVQQ